MTDYMSHKITLLNVFSTMTIVVLHAKSPERFGLELNMDNPFIFIISTFAQLGVPMFFFLSSMLFYRNISISNMKNKLQTRFYSLVIPYLLWNALFVFIFYMISQISFISDTMSNRGNFSTLDEIISTLLWSRSTDLWFVRDLILYSVFSPVIYILLKNKLSSLIFYICSLFILFLGNWGPESVWRWLPIYISGAIFGKFYFEKSNPLITKNKNFMSYIVILLLALLFIVLLVKSLSNNTALICYRLVSPIILWYITDVFFKKYISEKFVVRKWMSYMFFIYCTHHFVLNSIQKLVVLNFEPTTLVLNLTFIITPVITVLFLIKLASVLSQYKFYKVLTGGR